MRLWADFFPDVLPDVLGCPEPTVERHLFNAARRFCEQSRVWRVDLDPITTTSLPTVDLIYPAGAEAFELLGATLDGQRIDLEVADGTSLAERLAGTGGRTRVLTRDLLTATIIPTPGTGRSLVLEAVLRPAEGATGMPESVADSDRLAIATGALATLLKINRAPWANPALSAEKEMEFRSMAADAKSRTWRGNTNRRPRNRAQYY